MFHSLRDPFALILSAATFGLVLSIWLATLLIWQARRTARSSRIGRRLGIDGESDAGAPWPAQGEEAPGKVLRLWRDGTEATTIVPGQKARFLVRLERLRINSGLELPLRAILIGLAAILLTVFALVAMLTGSLLIGLGAAVALLQIIWMLVSQRVNKRRGRYDQQFVDALDLAARSLRVGHPLVASFQLIADEVGEPVGAVFAEIVQQQSLGMSLEQAVRRAAEESPSDDFKFFATSIVIQIRSGGNLADMMDRLSAVLRDRMRLSRRVRVLTAQTQFSKRILVALPILTLVTLNLINPEYMSVLWTTPAGHLVLATAAGGLLLGAWMMNVLAKQRV